MKKMKSEYCKEKKVVVNTDDVGEEKNNLLNIIVETVSPCLNFICAGGIIKGLLSILEITGLVQSGSGIDTLISAVGDTVFFFLPIFLGMNLARTLKSDQFLGAVIGAILCYPSINGTDLVIMDRTFNYTYTRSFLPVLAVVAVAAPWEKLLKKVIPEAVSNFLTSFSFMNLLEGNPDYIMGIACMTGFAQIGVVLAICIKTRDCRLRSLALSAFISGIVEPAIYGITLPRMKMYVLSCVGGAVCGGFIMLTDTMMYSFSSMGVFAILGMLNPQNPNLIIVPLCAVIPFIFSFAAAFLLYRDKVASTTYGNVPV